jgi:knotted carbamoyltransferase YgeW
VSKIESIRRKLESLNESTLESLQGRSMILTREWTLPEITALCDVAETFEVMDKAGMRTPLFPGELFYALFFDSSTRTKSSWAGASTRLGAHPSVVDGSTTQVGHGETAAETGTMLGMNAHALGIRHDLILGEGNTFMREAKRGIDEYLQGTGDARPVPVINLQCDIDHPTQTLADLCWLRERFPEGLAGKTMAVSWAYSPSYAKPLSVPQGLITLLARFGMHVRLAHPEGYDLMPECLEAAERAAVESGGSFTRTQDMDAAVEGADIVYPKSWGPYDLMLERVDAFKAKDEAAMREIESRALERNKLHTQWIYDERRMKLTRGGEALYMHCLPADIGAEVSPSVLERSRLDVAREANKKLFVIVALLAVSKEPDLRDRLDIFVT